MAETSRSFTVAIDGQDTYLTVRKPTQRELDHADMEKSRTYQQALRLGIVSRARMLKDMRATGTWTDVDDAELEKARVKAEEAQKALTEDKFATEQEKADCKELHKQLMSEYNEINRDLQGMLQNSCDSKADDRWRNYLMATTIEYASSNPTTKAVIHNKRVGKPVWDSVDELLSEDKFDLIERCYYEFIMFSNGLPSDWEKDKADDDKVDDAKVDGVATDVATDVAATPEADVTPAEPSDAETTAQVDPETGQLAAV